MTDASRIDWLRDDDPRSLARRVERVLVVLERETGEPCGMCGTAVCGHMVLLSLAAGYEDDPLCLPCLAQDLTRAVAEVRDGLVKFVLSKECLRRGWHLAGSREATPPDAFPQCLGPAGPAFAAPTDPAPTDPAPTDSSRATSAPVADAEWDAGDLGCGELVLDLRLRLRDMQPREVLHLRATDPGAPEDIPSWCRLTGNPLLHEDHPDYWIRRKD